MMKKSFTEAVRTALKELSTVEHRLLTTLLESPDHSGTATELRDALTLSHFVVVNRVMGTIGKLVHKEFGAHPDGLPVGSFDWWHVVALGTRVKTRGHIWTLRNEVVDALLGETLEINSSDLASEPKSRFEEIYELDTRFFEGLANTIQKDVKARSRKARDVCIQIHGWSCAVCGLNFKKIYGSIGKEFIHVHHLELLSTAAGPRSVNPKTDLAPVCPNCHAMLHRKEPPLSIAELRMHLQNQQTKFSETEI